MSSYIPHSGKLINTRGHKLIKGAGLKNTFNKLKKDIVKTSNKVVHESKDVIVPVVNNNSVNGFYDNAVKPIKGGAILSSVNIPNIKKRNQNNVVFSFD